MITCASSDLNPVCSSHIYYLELQHCDILSLMVHVFINAVAPNLAKIRGGGGVEEVEAGSQDLTKGTRGAKFAFIYKNLLRVQRHAHSKIF